MIKTMNDLIKATQEKSGKKIIAIACPEDESYFQALKKAREENIAEVLLVGDQALIEQLAQITGYPLEPEKVFSCRSCEEAAQKAVELVKSGRANILMKGMLHTDILLKAVLDKEKGLRTGKLLSHIALFEVPAYHKFLLITDVAMNIAPNLAEKKQILENAIELMHQIGFEQPKVAILGAVEDVNEKMPATLDAACLSKMAERKQIKGAIIDGPLALDNAISFEAAKEKGIVSPVAGDADILLVPYIEAGNILFKSLIFFADAQVGGIVLGASVPIVLTSRADLPHNKFTSLTLGAFLAV